MTDERKWTGAGIARYPASNVVEISGVRERSKIVEWLRSFGNYTLSESGAAAISLVADCIERGQHQSSDPTRGKWGWCDVCGESRHPSRATCTACLEWFSWDDRREVCP